MNSFIDSLSFFKCTDLTDKLCWQKIGKIVAISWIVFFAFDFIIMFGMWMDSPILREFWVIVSAVTIVLLITGIPGCIALIQPTIRKQLYNIPEAAALSAFILSFVLGFGLLFGINFLLYYMGLDASFMCLRPPCTFFSGVLEPIFTGLIIGILAFPLTIGLVFPFGICAGCALIVWIVVDEGGFISQKYWMTYVGASTLGWILLIIVGYALGNA